MPPSDVPSSYPVPDPSMNHHLHTQLTALVTELVRHKVDLQFAKRELESLYIREMLDANEHNIGRTAVSLGIHRNTLSKRIRELKITTRN